MAKSYIDKLSWCKYCHVAFRVFRGENRCPLCEKLINEFLVKNKKEEKK